MSQTVHALGIVCCNRWNLTYSTLNSLYYSEQDKSKYDLFIIDNGSNDENTTNLTNWLAGNILPYKNLFIIKQQVSIPMAWNLFLEISKDYDYRTKLDNDIVLMYTPNMKWDIQEESETMSAWPPVIPQGGVNPGAVPVASVIKSPGQFHAQIRKRRRLKQLKHSRFLDHATDFMNQHQVDIVAFAPVPPSSNFIATCHNLLNQKDNNDPYLVGGCIMISKKAFDILGFFDENLPRSIDMDYTQRAINNKLNIGYHDAYWVCHVGISKPTEEEDIKASKIQQARQLVQSRGRLNGFVSSKWSLVIDSLKDKMDNKVIVLR